MRALVRPGMALMVASSALFAAMAVMVKGLRGAIPTQEIVFFRSLLNVAFTLALIYRYRAPVFGRRKVSLFVRGAFGYAALSLHFYALTHLPLADAVVLHNSSPLLVAMLAPLALGERTGPRALAISAAGFLGTAIMVQPTGEVGMAAGLAALGGAAMSACAYVTIRGIGKSESALTVVLYFPMISAVLSAAPTAQAFVRPDGREALLLLGIGLSTTAAQIALTAALQRERAADATSVAYTSIVFAAALGALFFGEVPRAASLAGAAIVILAAALVAREGRAREESPAPAEAPQPEPICALSAEKS